MKEKNPENEHILQEYKSVILQVKEAMEEMEKEIDKELESENEDEP